MKTSNKGFSLVELIIVIAIMAILAAAIAPALIRYIDKSRKADDVTAAGTINSAVSSALANEDAYDEIQSATANKAFLEADNANTKTPDKFKLATGAGVTAADTFIYEVNSNVGGTPGIKYKKNGTSSWKWQVGITASGKPIVWINDGNVSYELQPTIHPSYK
jgi:type IV pilus assembly protein PilA